MNISSFLITHGPQGSRVRPVRSNVLPAGMRLTIAAEDEAEIDLIAQPDESAAAVIDRVAHPDERDATAIDLDATQPRGTIPEGWSGVIERTPGTDTPLQVLLPPRAGDDAADDGAGGTRRRRATRWDDTVTAPAPEFPEPGFDAKSTTQSTRCRPSRLARTRIQRRSCSGFVRSRRPRGSRSR